MEILLYLIPAALGLGLIGLIAFLWALKSGQFDDLDGAAHRILFDDDDGLRQPAQPEREDHRPTDRNRESS
ncbi:MAG: cbb3-type cytochrome oxidase assembly protein CcoS [Rhodospirillales bacterium]|nr:MAG: cbb3-type cytochrome oxidase assembly protein CcoS [Rhodospirillales bacterium]